MNIDPPHGFIPGLADKTKCHWSLRGHLCGFGESMHESDPIDDRRQRAREAAQDARTIIGDEMIEVAIETATRVQITPEIKEAAWRASGYGGDIPDDAYDKIITAAFEAAGFEVES